MDSIRKFVEENVRALLVGLVVFIAIITISLLGSNTAEEPSQSPDESQTSQASQASENQSTAQQTQRDGTMIGSDPLAGPVEVDETKERYQATVRTGDNQTVIARQMVNEFLADESKNLSAEQRLYMETVVVDNLPRNDLVIAGEVIEVDKSIIAEATQAAEALTEAEQSRWAVFL